MIAGRHWHAPYPTTARESDAIFCRIAECSIPTTRTVSVVQSCPEQTRSQSPDDFEIVVENSQLPKTAMLDEFAQRTIESAFRGAIDQVRVEEDKIGEYPITP